ncbi:MAG: hypothetical protein V3T78_01750, partial [Dehalococcoidia bacterium]
MLLVVKKIEPVEICTEAARYLGDPQNFAPTHWRADRDDRIEDLSYQFAPGRARLATRPLLPTTVTIGIVAVAPFAARA